MEGPWTAAVCLWAHDDSVANWMVTHQTTKRTHTCASKEEAEAIVSALNQIEARNNNE